MTIARDVSSPARVGLIGNGSGTSSGTSASFTPPNNSLVTVSISCDASSTTPASSVTNTGPAVTWTKKSQGANATGGVAIIYEGFVATGSAMTVTASVTTGRSASNENGGAYVDVWTGANSSQGTAATANGSSSTQNISPSLTTTATNSQVIGTACEWQDFGADTSTDTFTAYTNTNIAGIRAYKASVVPSSGTNTSINFAAPAAGPTWSYALLEILDAGGGGGGSAPQMLMLMGLGS